MYFKQHFYVCIDIIVSFNLTQFWPLTISPFTCCFTYILYTSSSSSSNKFLEWERVLLSAVFCQGKYQVLTALVLMFGYFMIDSEKTSKRVDCTELSEKEVDAVYDDNELDDDKRNGCVHTEDQGGRNRTKKFGEKLYTHWHCTVMKTVR